MPFDYDGSKYDPDAQQEYRPIPEGQHRAEIVAVVTKNESGGQLTSSKGNPMMYIDVKIAGFENRYPVRQYIVDNEFFVKNIGDILDSCGENPNTKTFNVALLKGMRGVVQIKHEEYQGKTNAKIHYWVSQKKQSAELIHDAPQESTGKTGIQQDADSFNDEIPF